MRKEEGGPAPSGEREARDLIDKLLRLIRMGAGHIGTEMRAEAYLERTNSEGPTAQPSPLTWTREKFKLEEEIGELVQQAVHIGMRFQAHEIESPLEVTRHRVAITKGILALADPTPPEGGSQ